MQAKFVFVSKRCKLSRNFQVFNWFWGFKFTQIFLDILHNFILKLRINLKIPKITCNITQKAVKTVTSEISTF